MTRIPPVHQRFVAIPGHVFRVGQRALDGGSVFSPAVFAEIGVVAPGQSTATVAPLPLNSLAVASEKLNTNDLVAGETAI